MTLTFASIAAFGDPWLHASVAQWAANIFIAAPAFHQRYMDMVCWSIVCEIVFYVLVAVAIALNLFDRRLPSLIAGWLVLSVFNEFVLHSEILQRVFITKYSGAFASGVLLYLYSRGDRGARIACLLMITVWLGAVQAGWSADWLRERGADISSAVAIAGGAIAPVIVGSCMFMRRLPWRSSITLALGGITYPLYLIHQFFGYVIFNKLEGIASSEFIIPAMVVFMLVLSFVIYRYLERPAQRWTREFFKAMVQAKPALGAPSAAGTPTRML
jgi:peptidoglycan/LPS O-acetylase OafA/YrhL